MWDRDAHERQTGGFCLCLQQFGRGLDRARTDKFVGMYVNDLTLAYGERGRLGLERLMSDAYQHGLIPQRVPVGFHTIWIPGEQLPN